MRVLTATALAVLATTGIRAQEPHFNGVSVLVTVLDRQGNPVRNLQQQDFTVRDNGKPQNIVFQNELKPVSFVVLLDMSNSLASKRGLMRSAAGHFLKNMSAEDRAQVGTFTESLVFNGRFTNDRDLLVRALDGVPPGTASRLYDALDESLDRLASIGGYSSIVVFSDGMDTASRRPSTDVLTKARNQGVIVYTIGVQPDALSVPPRTIRQRVQKGELQRLADETGGGYFELTDTREPVESAFARIAQEIHSAYVLGFIPTQRDGKHHTLEVRAKSGMSVRARRGYVAPRDLP